MDAGVDSLAWLGRRVAVVGKFIVEHEDRIADDELGVHDFRVWSLRDITRFSAKRLLVKSNCLPRVAHNDLGGKGGKIFFVHRVGHGLIIPAIFNLRNLTRESAWLRSLQTGAGTWSSFCRAVGLFQCQNASRGKGRQDAGATFDREMTDEDIRKDVLVAFEYCYLHDDWVNPLGEALDGLTAQQAVQRCGPETKGVWEIVLHLAVWNENIVERILTGERARPLEGAWPPLPEDSSEHAWEGAKKRLWDSLALVRSTVESVPFEKLTGPPYGLPDLFCRFTHMAYHIGQITKLRECWEMVGG